MNENEIVSECDRCGKEIARGTAYVCITKNIEQIEYSIVNNQDEAQIIQSDILIALCGSCGNKFDTETLIKLINMTSGGNGTLQN